MGTSDHPPNLLITSNFLPWQPPLPISHLDTIDHPLTFPSLQFSHLGTSHYPPHFTTTPNVAPGHIQLPTHLPHHIQFDTWTPLIHPPLSPSLPISHLGTSHYPSKFATTPHFTPGHIQLHTQFHHRAHLITHPLSLPLAISHLGSSNSSPLSSPLPISQLGTSHYLLNFTTTPNFTLGHIILPTHFHYHLWFHTWAPPITIIFPTTSNFTLGHLPLSTQHHHTLQCPSWPLSIAHPLSPLSLSQLGTLDYLPTFTTTSNFTLHHLQLPTSFDQHFHFHTWSVSIT